jgi:hypothetical protein
MADFPQQTFAGKKRSATEYEHGGGDLTASTREPKRLRPEDAVEPPQPANVLAGKKRTANEFDVDNEQVPASAHDAKRLRTETGPADRLLHASGSKPLPQMGRNLHDFPPITQSIPAGMPLHEIPFYFPNHLQGHFLRRFIKEGWTWNQVFGCVELMAKKAFAKDHGLEHNMGGSIIKTRYEEETRKMREEEAQALLESTREMAEPTKPASPALPAVLVDDPLPDTKDLYSEEWQELISLEARKHLKFFQDHCGSPDRNLAAGLMKDFWNRRTQVFETWALERFSMEAKDLTTPRGTFRELLIRMNEMLTAGRHKHFPGPTDVASELWRAYQVYVNRWTLKRAVQELRYWTEMLEDGYDADSDLVEPPRGQAGGNLIPGQSEMTGQLGASLSDGAYTEPGRNFPRPQGQSRQDEPQPGHGDMGQPENRQTRATSSSSRSRRAHSRHGSAQIGAVTGVAAGYGNGYPHSASTYPAYAHVQSQPAGVAAHAHPLPNVAHQQPPAQAGQGQPGKKRPGAPRRKMFVNAPDRDTPLPQSALTSNQEILDHFPEHLSHPGVMQRFVASPATGSRGYHTTDMVKALLRHINTHDFNGITEEQRKENIRRWVIKERDACNKQLKAGRVLASLPPGMIAPPQPAQPGVQATQPNFAGMPMSLQNVQAPSNYPGMHIPPPDLQAPSGFPSMPLQDLQAAPGLNGMSLPIQHLQAPPNHVGMHISPPHLQARPGSTLMPLQDSQAPLGTISMPMPHHDVQVPPSYAGMHIPPSLQAPPDSISMPPRDLQAPPGTVSMPALDQNLEAIQSFADPLVPSLNLPTLTNSMLLDLQEALGPGDFSVPYQDLQAPQSLADPVIPPQSVHAPPSYVNMAMLGLILPQTATLHTASNAIGQEYEPQFGSVSGGFNDPAMPSTGFGQGGSDTSGLETEAGATEAPTAEASIAPPTSPGIALDEAGESSSLGTEKAVPQAEETLCENQDTAVGFDMDQLPRNEFDDVLDEYETRVARDMLDQLK